MAFPDLRAALVAQSFATFGEDARWNGATELVKVRLRDSDVVSRFSDAEFVAASVVLRVRKTDLTAPVDGDEVVIERTGDRYRIIGTPRLDVRGVWLCDAAALP